MLAGAHAPEPPDGPSTIDVASVMRALAAIASPTIAVLSTIVELWTGFRPLSPDGLWYR